MTTRKIIHVDMDAFFASVEQRDDPALRGRPVAVGSASGRGVVAAASYEARRFGVRSAMPSARALRQCPDLVFVRPRFEVYRAVSQQIRAIFLDYTPLVEPLSLDEAYLDVTANLKGLPTATATATEIRDRIRAETGLTASAGISYNKLLAKLASDQHKPDGQCVITPARGPAFVAALPIGRFHGIARGEDARAVNPDRPRKSSGSETTFSTDLIDPAAIEAALLGQAESVWRWVERTGARGRTVTVKARYADFRTVTRSRTLGRAVDARATLDDTALLLIRSLYPLARGLRLLGVTLSGFETEEPLAELDF